MQSIFAILNEVSHQLNSPLASAKSYVYLSKRLLEKDNKEKTMEYLDLLDKKIDMFARRVDLVLTALKLETSRVDLVYELFNLSQLIPGAELKRDILADRGSIAQVIDFAKELTGADTLSVTEDPKNATIVFPYDSRAQSDDKDIRTEFIEKAIVIHGLVSRHGGTIKDDEKKLTITLPFKAKK